MMGKLNIFEICYTNLTGVYYAGQVVEGIVTVELKEPMKMRGIRMKFKGEAYVIWEERRTEKHGHEESDVKDTYFNSEKYFDQESLLFGIWPNQGNRTQELPAGRHTFPFSFQLPFNLPSSFEDYVGYVRYTVIGIIDKPWKFNHKTKRPFTIIGVLDLNQIPGAQQRLQVTKEKNVCCLCCKSGPIKATFNIERTGYVPGEAIKIYAEISNGSSRRIDKSYINLIMYKTFHAVTRARTDIQEIARVTRPSIPAHSEDVWSGENLVIPPLPPSYLQGCRIIDINYILKLNVDPTGPSLDLIIPFEVIIGTVPLAFVVESCPPMPPSPIAFEKLYQWDLTPPAPPPDAMAALPPGNKSNNPPPSYKECITGPYSIRDKDDNEHVKGQLSYAPSYTYYNWGHKPSGLPS